MLLKILAGSAAGLLAAACAGESVMSGATLLPQERPAQTVPCEGAPITDIEKEPPNFPAEMLMFIEALHVPETSTVISLAYDVTPDGTTANIRYVGPERYMEHKTWRRGILAGAKAVSDWRFSWDGAATPHYAEGCGVDFDFTTG